MKKILLSLVFLWLVLTNVTAQTNSWPARPAEYAMKSELGIKVAMGDGAVLLVDVYSPADSIRKIAGQKFPVLLTQSPYAFMNEAPRLGYIDYYVKRGYICVVAHIRGTNGSGGKNEFLSPREQEDGPEIVAWAATQLPHGNGKIGLFGTSWLGFTQLSTAAKIGKNSPVKAIVPTYMGAFPYRELTPGGVPSQSIYFPRDFDQPGMLGNDSTSAVGKRLFKSWSGGGELALEGEFWKSRQPINYLEQVQQSEIPILLVGGWQDLYPIGISELYAALQNLHACKSKFALMDFEQAISPNYHLVMGPWGHYKGLNVDMTLAWYDKWLMDKEIPQFTTDNPYHAIDMMTGIWYDFSTYPFTTNYHSFALGKDLSLSTPNFTASLRFGPRTEVNTSLSFQTKPFTEEMVLAGPGSVRLLATTSSKDITFLVELFLIDEKGIKTRITQGNVIASLSELDQEKSWKSGDQFIRPYLQLTQEIPVSSGKEYVLEFPLAPRLATIDKGNRLEVLISSMPTEEDCTGNLGVFPCLPTEQQLERLQGGTFEIKLDGAVSSRILLPVIPKGKMKVSKLNYDSTPNHPF
jgi:uncharacterized protein